jgi:methyltransferase (TIGR00027 family)
MESRHSSTAYWIAAARARETARPDALFQDPYAAALAGERGFAMLDRQEQLASRDNPFLVIRTRYFDDVLVAAGGWVKQVVLLGAGFDTRAFRLPLTADVTFFELDHRDVFETKERVLAEQGAIADRARKLVPVDLTGVWTDELTRSGFDPQAPTLWLAEGLFFYLEPADVPWVLRQASALSHGPSLFGADFFGTGLLRLPSMKPYLKQLQDSGQPYPYCNDHPEQLFLESGWPSVSLVEPGHELANFGRIAPRLHPQEGEPTAMRAYLVLGKRD